MGNDNSKVTLENQQLLLQLQQQALNNNQNQNQYHANQQYNIHRQSNSNLPVISPVELQQRVMHPTYATQNHQTNQSHNNEQHQPQHQQHQQQPRTLMDILHNKKLMSEIEKNPQTKRKFLERLLSEHQHIMTSNQVTRIKQMLDSLPPANNNFQPREHLFASVNNTLPSTTSSSAIGWNEGTTSRDPSSRALERTQQLDSIDALTKHYKTEAEREEAEFKLEEERRRKEFYEKQRHRRSQYQTKLSEFEKNDVDALKVFNLKPNYTLDELKKAFRKQALIYHPDKPTGNDEQFQFITKCFMLLLEKQKNRESDKQFTDLKQGSKAYLEDQTKNYSSNTKVSSPVIQKDKFDVKLFNKIYEDNKLWDSNDDGHGSWFSSNDVETPPDELFGRKFNISVFNSAFEEYKERLNPNAGAIEQYHEPSELVSCNTGFTEIELSAKKVDDFSKPLPIAGVGGKGKDLAFTDLKVAYTSRNAFIDPSKVEYKTYKSIDELKRDRGNVRYDMTPEELRVYNMKQMQKQEEEERRQYLVQQRDNVTADSYSKIHQKMLGYRGNAPS
jgi:curved DNA-binding protein CbpA